MSEPLSLPGLQALIEQWKERGADRGHQPYYQLAARHCAYELEAFLAVDPMMVNPADDLESLRWQLQNALRRIQELSALLVVQGGVQHEEKDDQVHVGVALVESVYGKDDPRSRCGSAALEGQDLRDGTPTSDVPSC